MMQKLKHTKFKFLTNKLYIYEQANKHLPEFIELILDSEIQYEYYITSIQIDELCEISDCKMDILDLGRVQRNGYDVMKFD